MGSKCPTRLTFTRDRSCLALAFVKTHAFRDGIACAFRCCMPTLRTYKDLDAWKQAMDLVEQCYRISKGFPRDERFGLTSQLRRAAVSIPSNVAEGHCRRKTRVYAHHVSIALGSHGELETLIEVSTRLGFISPQSDADSRSGRIPSDVCSAGCFDRSSTNLRVAKHATSPSLYP